LLYPVVMKAPYRSVKKRSDLFYVGQRLGKDSMLQVSGSVDPLSWRQVICLCDCGNTVVLPYQHAYAGRFSCGCRRRIRQDCADHAGLRVHNGAGNNGEGRTLTVLCRDEKTQLWIYLCECCAATFDVPRGMERGVRGSLRGIAGETCPNWIPFYPNGGCGLSDAYWERYGRPVEADYGLAMHNPPGHNSADKDYTWAAPFYKPERVKRGSGGEVLGVYGLPTEGTPPGPRPTSVWAHPELPDLPAAVFATPVPEDMDGMAAVLAEIDWIAPPVPERSGRM